MLGAIGFVISGVELVITADALFGGGVVAIDGEEVELPVVVEVPVLAVIVVDSVSLEENEFIELGVCGVSLVVFSSGGELELLVVVEVVVFIDLVVCFSVCSSSSPSPSPSS